MNKSVFKTYAIPCIIAIVLCLLIASLAGWVTQANIPTWFAHLQKPSFNPPAWLFGPVWTVLYIMIGIAGGIIWVKRQQYPKIMLCYVMQLLFNFLWSFIFFAGHQLGWALLDMLALGIFLFLTLLISFKNLRIVFWLLLPYFCWICFAFTLNFSLWRLN